MTPLVAFPTELLGQIFDGLPQADLASLCKTQSTLRKAAEPLLYENIQFLWTEEKVPSVAQFLRIIIARPNLARHVRHLKLLGSTFYRVLWQSGPRDLSTPRIPVDMDSLAPLIREIESLRLPYEASWVEQLRAGRMDAFIALLLTRTARLRSLVMEGNFTQETLLLSRVLRSALCSHDGSGLPDFSDLHTVVFDSQYTQSRRAMFRNGNTENVLPLFYLPKLREFKAFIDTPESGALEWPITLPSLSNLTSLNVEMLRETALEQVLRATPRLRSLTWWWVYANMDRPWSWARTINLDMVATALNYVKDTLENLNISAAVDIGRHNIEYESLELRGNLRCLSAFKMKSLRMPWPFLVGFSIDNGIRFSDVIPASVEDLTISEDFAMVPDYEWEGEEMMERLEEYLGSLRLSGVSLQTLHLICDPFSSNWIQSTKNTEWLKDYCARHEVKFQVIKEYM